MTTGINAFDRVVINPRERPLSSDINMAQARLDQSIREIVRGLFLPHAIDPKDTGQSGFTPRTGFMGDGFFVTANGASRNVVVNPGLGFLLGTTAANFGGVSGVDDLNAYFPCYLPAALTIPIDAAPSVGQDRFDIIEVMQDRRLENPSSRDVLDTGTGIFTAQSVNKTFAYALDSSRYARVVSPAVSTTGISYKVGVAAPTGGAAIPAATAGYTVIAVIKSIGGEVNIAQTRVRDDRQLLFPNESATLGISIEHEDGPPDVLYIRDAALPPGVRVAVRSTNLGVAGSPVRVLVFGGGNGLFSLNSLVAQTRLGSTSIPSNFILANASIAGFQQLTTAEAALIAGQVEALADDTGKGQQYYAFTVYFHAVTGSTGGTKYHDIVAACHAGT